MRLVRALRPSRLATYALLTAALIYFSLPFYLMVVNGLKPFRDFSPLDIWSVRLSGQSLGAFQAAWSFLSPAFWNSARVVAPATAVVTLLGALNGYVLSHWRFRHSNLVFLLIMFGMFLPEQAVLIPLVLTLRTMNLWGSGAGLGLTFVIFTLPVSTLIFRVYFGRIPVDLLEAARMDGAGFVRIFRYIIVPLGLPALAVALIWNMTRMWNDYILALVVLANPDDWTVMVRMNHLRGPVGFAGALIASGPALVVFLLLGRWFQQGILTGALRG